MLGDPRHPQAQGDRCDRRLPDLFILRGVSAHIRSDNGPEFVARAVQGWIAAVGAKTACIEYLFNDWHFEILFIVAIILQLLTFPPRSVDQ
jgi:hypothetical protein